MRWLHGRHRVPWPNDSLQRTLRPFLYEAALPTPIISSCPPSLMSPHQWPVIRYLRPLRRNQIHTHHGYKGYRDSNGPKNTSGIPKSIRLPKLRRLERKKKLIDPVLLTFSFFISQGLTGWSEDVGDTEVSMNCQHIKQDRINNNRSSRSWVMINVRETTDSQKGAVISFKIEVVPLFTIRWICHHRYSYRGRKKVVITHDKLSEREKNRSPS